MDRTVARLNIDHYRRLLAEEKDEHTVEYRVRRADGELRWVRATVRR